MLKLLSLLMIMTLSVPKPEYPRPQFERDEWVNLNGEGWTYCLDNAHSGWERKLYEATGFENQIIVPFAPESELSGVGASNTDFIEGMWYHKTIRIPEEWKDKTIMLNFGAVYYESEIFIDGEFVQRHVGGSDSFSIDITKFVEDGFDHNLVVSVKSDLRSLQQPAGKQCLRVNNFECTYTRTTGIWQTVWMEPISKNGLDKVKIVTDIDQAEVSFDISTKSSEPGDRLSIKVLDSGRLVSKSSGLVSDGSRFVLPIPKMKLWEPGHPNLYDVIFELKDHEGKVVDRVKSYFGMRKIHTSGNRIYLNNKPFYQRLVLDQGFFPDGGWTSPSDEALKHDIELAMKCGFNGSRMHQKVFEPRYMYWADKLGFVTWGEFPSWGADLNDSNVQRNIMSEWRNVIERDVNHPSIITWTPLNESFWTDESSYPRFVEDLYHLTKSIDNTRPVNTTSGGIHILTDIWSVHHYEQDADKLWDILYGKGKLYGKDPKQKMLTKYRGNVGFNPRMNREAYSFPTYDGTIPYMLDEFGGMKCKETNSGKGLWGYGKDPETKEDYYERLEKQVRMLADHSDIIWGWCFTQLTDVEQEQNGIFYYDRSEKFDIERLNKIFTIEIK